MDVVVGAFGLGRVGHLRRGVGLVLVVDGLDARVQRPPVDLGEEGVRLEAVRQRQCTTNSERIPVDVCSASLSKSAAICALMAEVSTSRMMSVSRSEDGHIRGHRAARVHHQQLRARHQLVEQLQVDVDVAEASAQASQLKSLPMVYARLRRPMLSFDEQRNAHHDAVVGRCGAESGFAALDDWSTTETGTPI